MQDKIDELTKIKDEQIEKLTKIKDVLKNKLDEAKKENADLHKEIEELKSCIDDVQKSSQKSELDDNLLEIIGDQGKKMDFVVKQIENLISIVVKKPNLTTSEPIKIVKKKPERKITRNIERITSQSDEVQVMGQKPIKESQSITMEPKLEEKNRENSEEGYEEEQITQPAAPPERKMLAIPYPDDGVYRCPKCNKQKWKEMQNKNRMLSPGVFSKFYYCMTCRTEWEYMY